MTVEDDRGRCAYRWAMLLFYYGKGISKWLQTPNNSAWFPTWDGTASPSSSTVDSYLPSAYFCVSTVT